MFKGVFSSGVKVFNSLLQSINNISNNLVQFKSALKNDLLVHAFYSAEEFIQASSINKVPTIQNRISMYYGM
jgi:hypothetical protein